LRHELYVAESDVDEVHFSVDELWDEFFSALPLQSSKSKGVLAMTIEIHYY